MADIFANIERTERVEIPGGWAELCCEVTVGDRREAQKAASFRQHFRAQNRAERRRKQDDESEGEISQEFSVTDYCIALLERKIVAWSSDQPVTRAAIERLPEATLDLLMQKLNEWNESRTEDEDGNLEKTSSTSSEAPGRNGQPGLATPPVPAGRES